MCHEIQFSCFLLSKEWRQLLAKLKWFCTSIETPCLTAEKQFIVAHCSILLQWIRIQFESAQFQCTMYNHERTVCTVYRVGGTITLNSLHWWRRTTIVTSAQTRGCPHRLATVLHHTHLYSSILVTIKQKYCKVEVPLGEQSKKKIVFFSRNISHIRGGVRYS